MGLSLIFADVTIGLIRRFNNTFLNTSLMTIYIIYLSYILQKCLITLEYVLKISYEGRILYDNIINKNDIRFQYLFNFI